MTGYMSKLVRFIRTARAGLAAGIAVFLAASPVRAASLTLPDAIERALNFAPSLALASATSDLSEARTREMRAPMLPSVSAGTEYYQAPGYAEVITNRGLSSAMLALNYTAWDFGRRLARLEAAKYASQAAQLGVAAARAQIAFDTAVAYFDLVRARKVVGELQSNLDRLNRYVGMVETLHRTGRAIVNDVLKVRSARDSAEFALVSAQNDRRRAAIVLGSLIGDFTASDFDVIDPATTAPPMKGRLSSSPVLAAAKRAEAAAAMQVKAAEAERYPTLQIALTTGYLGVDPPDTFDHRLGASYDAVVSMPLFQGGLISSRIDQAKANKARAAAQAKQTEYLLRRRLEDAMARYAKGRKALRLLERAQPTADDAFALTWTRFLGGGNVTLLEVLDAYRQAETLRLSRFDQEFAMREASAETALLYGRIG